MSSSQEAAAAVRELERQRAAKALEIQEHNRKVDEALRVLRDLPNLMSREAALWRELGALESSLLAANAPLGYGGLPGWGPEAQRAMEQRTPFPRGYRYPTHGGRG